MKEFFKYTAVFVFLTLALSGLSGCGSQAPTSNTSAPSNVDTATGEVPKRSSEYPPVNSAVAGADIKRLDGTTFKVADKQGKVVLLNMWATWCGPCRQEMPELVKLQDEYREKGFEVIGLNTDDEEAAKISEFSASMKLNYELVWADSKLQNELLKISKFGGIPQSFLIDRDGNLRGVFTSANPSTIAKLKEIVAKVVDGDESVASLPSRSTAPVQNNIGTDTTAAKDSK
jgi:thiol-disulfide isomerase/thioredoxin